MSKSRPKDTRHHRLVILTGNLREAYNHIADALAASRSPANEIDREAIDGSVDKARRNLQEAMFSLSRAEQEGVVQ